MSPEEFKKFRTFWADVSWYVDQQFLWSDLEHRTIMDYSSTLLVPRARDVFTTRLGSLEIEVAPHIKAVRIRFNPTNEFFFAARRKNPVHG